MTRARTYLDWNATAPLGAEARAAMCAALELTGNPSSPHGEGRRVRAVMEDAREQVAALVGAAVSEVVFTSGGTEANNTVLAGGWDVILVAGVEHHSVLAPARGSGARIIELAVDANGVLRLDALDAHLRAVTGQRALLSVQVANNETGVLQPVREAAGLAREHGVAVHTDAVQAAGRIAIDMDALGVQLLTLSAHKLGGPKGAGALIVRDGTTLPALICGGGQERRRRAGTENVAAFAGFGAAAAAVRAAGSDAMRALRDRLEAQVLELTPGAVVIGKGTARLPNTTGLAVAGLSAETLVIAFDLAGIAVSAGAACSSGKVGASHVLAAIGLAPDLARAAIRVSLGPCSTAHDVDAFVDAWGRLAARGNVRQVA